MMKTNACCLLYDSLIKRITRTRWIEKIRNIKKLVKSLPKKSSKKQTNQQAMGKNLRTNSSNMSIPQSHNPRCMWGIFHVLKYHHWNRRFIKKRILNKKQGTGDENAKDEAVEGSNENVEDTLKHKTGEAANAKVEGKKKQTSTGSKTSVKSRLKALITEEVAKRKGRGKHQRCSTYPIQTKSDTDQHVDAHIDDLLPETEQGSPRTSDKNKGIRYESGSEDHTVSKSPEEHVTSDEDDEEHGVGKGSVEEKNMKKLLESAVLSPEELEAKKKALEEHGKDIGPGYESKYLMDALDIIKMNQGFLLTVLQDPDSPLAHHFHKHLAISAKMGMPQMEGLGSSVSVGSKQCGESSNRDGTGEDNGRKSMPLIAADHRAEGIHILNQTKGEMADVGSSSAMNRSEMVKKRFKSLRENIKHVIQERKKERRRIAMDAVLHKIPHQKGFSKDLTKDIIDHFKEPSRLRKVFSSSLARRGSMRLERRISFNEAIDKYTQLYESSFNKEGREESTSKRDEKRDEPIDTSGRTTKKYMRRFLSSPELYSSAYLYEALASEVPTKVSESLGYSSEVETLRKTEYKDSSIGVREGFPVSSEPISQAEKAGDESENSVIVKDDVTQIKPDNKPVIMTITELEEPVESSKLQEPDIKLKQSIDLPEDEVKFTPDLQPEIKDTTPKVADVGIYKFKEFEPLKELDIHNKHEFKYVKDVLELSGFSGTEALGAWHADQQPLDPMMYEEVKGCIICDPSCSMEDEEVSCCNHPLLFDLINEVLIDVYERSYNYYPRVLSQLCHIHPMPMGQHVLEKVWETISWYLSFKTGYDKPLDYVASRDLMRNDGWMNLQFEHECLGLEVEEQIFNDLLEEICSST
ncbi:hypothetical protein J1N35_024270 [Gossypium stocksii]|uniref:DUF4378 domain-containing protein n=1 Tax=Gossypium stocksii TaxID=47602 RepID=A0A9D3VL52_9ROSI|nr:hypothetical protein J1N35_024270 [Gossypium stocksii]